MECYLDNAATTKASDSVREVMDLVLGEDFGNPSSLHKKGMRAEQYVKAARIAIAKTLKAEPKEIVFTSGGTEANNLALIGAALARRRTGKHIIATSFEHASVHAPLLFLEKMGFEISFVPVDKNGHMILEELLLAMRQDTVLVSVMYVNNELGAVQDIAGIAGAVKKKKPDVLFHTDAIQAYGKYCICPKKEGIDLLSASGHKFHGPKGSGFLYIRDKVHILPILHGGGQQKGMRSGTENVAGSAGIALAAKMMYQNLDRDMERMYGLREMLISGVSQIEDVKINGCPGREGAAHIVSLSVRGVRSEVLLHALEEQGIYVSAGSACASNKPQTSATLKAMKLPRELWDSTIRFSFSVYTTREEIDYTLGVMYDMIPMLRKYTRR